MRINTMRACEVLTRPSWMKADRNWDIFSDYKRGLSTMNLGTLYELSPQQIRKIVASTLTRYESYGLSTRAQAVLRAIDCPVAGFDMKNLAVSLQNVYWAADNWARRNRSALPVHPNRYQILQACFMQQKNCSKTTTDELLAFMEGVLDAYDSEYLTLVPVWYFNDSSDSGDPGFPRSPDGSDLVRSAAL